jgi:hypothetical protein
MLWGGLLVNSGGNALKSKCNDYHCWLLYQIGKWGVTAACTYSFVDYVRLGNAVERSSIFIQKAVISNILKCESCT